MGKRRRDWMSSQAGRRKTVLQLNDYRYDDYPNVSPKKSPVHFSSLSSPHHKPDHNVVDTHLAGERSMDAEVAEFLKEISALSTSEDAENVTSTTSEKVMESEKADRNHFDAGTAEWQQCWDDRTQFHYYWNVHTNEVSWQPPPGFSVANDLDSNAEFQKMDSDEEEEEEKIELITYYGPPSPETRSEKENAPTIIGPQFPPHMINDQKQLDSHNGYEAEKKLAYGSCLDNEDENDQSPTVTFGPLLPPNVNINDGKEHVHNIVDESVIDKSSSSPIPKHIPLKESINAGKLKKLPPQDVARDSPKSEGQCSKSSEDDAPSNQTNLFIGPEALPSLSSTILEKDEPEITETTLIKKRRKENEKKYRRHKEHKKKHSRDNSERKHHHKDKHRKHLESPASSASSTSGSDELLKLKQHKEVLQNAIQQDNTETSAKKNEPNKNVTVQPQTIQLLSTHYYEDEESESEKSKNVLKTDSKTTDDENKDSSKKEIIVSIKSKQETVVEKIDQKTIDLDQELTNDILEQAIDDDEIDRQLELALERKLKKLEEISEEESSSKQNSIKTESTTHDKKKKERTNENSSSENSKSFSPTLKMPNEESVENVKNELSEPSTINDSEKESQVIDEMSLEAIDEMSKTICEKLDFLDISRKTISKLHTLILELETRVQDYHAGALEKHYFIIKLKEAANQLQQFESSAVPSGWSCHWDRDFKRYFYSNNSTGHTQWDYPEEKTLEEITSVPTTESQNTENEKLNENESKEESKISIPVVSSISLHSLPESSEPPPPGVDVVLPPPLPASEPPPPPPPIHTPHHTVDLEEGEIEDVEMEIEDSLALKDSNYTFDSEPGLVIAKPPQPAPSVPSPFFLYGDANCLPPGVTVYPSHSTLPAAGYSATTTLAFNNFSSLVLAPPATVFPQPVVLPNPLPPVAPPPLEKPSLQQQASSVLSKVEESKVIKKEKKFKKKKISLSLKKKNLSSLVEKWQQIKEEVTRISESESEEEVQSIEDWKRQQIESGEALDNANFEEIGDWRARLKAKTDKH